MFIFIHMFILYKNEWLEYFQLNYIQYMYNSSQNQYLHHISTCVLENMSVSYGGDRYRTYEANSKGAPPTESTLTLNFKELEMMTRERIKEGH